MSAAQFQIGEVADRCGLSLRTVRYYEEQGLVEPDARTEGGFRLYTDHHVDRLTLIKQMKPLGFTVAQMRELLDARDTLADPDATPEKRSDAADDVRGYAKDAAARCEELREQLDRATDFAKTLKRETRRVTETSAASE